MLQEAIKLDDSAIDYPARLRGPEHRERYPSLWVLGDARLLDHQLLGVLCSARCPGRVIVRTYDLARAFGRPGFR